MDEGYVVAIKMWDDSDGIHYFAEDPGDDDNYQDVSDELEEATIFETKKEAEKFVKKHKEKIFWAVDDFVDDLDDLAIEIYTVKTSVTTKLVKSYPYEGE